METPLTSLPLVKRSACVRLTSVPTRPRLYKYHYLFIRPEMCAALLSSGLLPVIGGKPSRTFKGTVCAKPLNSLGRRFLRRTSLSDLSSLFAFPPISPSPPLSSPLQAPPCTNLFLFWRAVLTLEGRHAIITFSAASQHSRLDAGGTSHLDLVLPLHSASLLLPYLIPPLPSPPPTPRHPHSPHPRHLYHATLTPLIRFGGKMNSD